MAYTQTQLDALQAALASGELRVQFKDRTVEYRSIAELKQAIALVENAINSAGGTPTVRQYRVVTEKGL